MFFVRVLWLISRFIDHFVDIDLRTHHYHIVYFLWRTLTLTCVVNIVIGVRWSNDLISGSGVNFIGVVYVSTLTADKFS